MISEIFLVFSFQKFDYDVPWHRFLWICLVWCLLNFLNLWVYVLCQIWEVFSHYSQHMTCPLSLSPFLPSLWRCASVRSFIRVLQVPEALFILFFFQFISSLLLDWVISFVLFSSSLILSSVLSILLLSTSIEYFGYCIFQVLKVPFDSFLYLFFLLRLSIGSGFNCSWWLLLNFCQVILTSLSSCVNIYWLSFFIQFKIFLVIGMMSCLFLKSWHCIL